MPEDGWAEGDTVDTTVPNALFQTFTSDTSKQGSGYMDENNSSNEQ